MTFKFSFLTDRITRSLELWRKVLALLQFSSRRLGLIVFLLTALEILLLLGALLIVKHVTEVTATSGNIRADAGLIFAYVAIILGLFLAGRVVQSVANYFRAAQGFVVSDYVNQAIQERAVAADLSFYDSALYYDSLERARQAGAQRPAQVIANALGVLRGALLLGAIAVVTVTIEWLILPVSLVAVALVMLVQIRFTRERFERQRALVQKEREAFYADYLMTTEPFAKEIRLWNLGDYLRETYMKLRILVRQDYLAIEKRKSQAEIVVAIMGAALFCGAAGVILWRFGSGQATISDLVMVILLLLRAETAGRDFVSSLSRLYDDQLFLNQMFQFLELQPVIQSRPDNVPLPAPNDQGVALDHVSFRYPGAEGLALDDVSLQVRPGRFTALVGGNGSGKTTLIKLLCRLYDPQDGRVTFRGVDIRRLDPILYRRQFSVIFQDFVQFAFSGRDNLRLAELGQPADEARLKQAAVVAGADEVLSNLPQGYHTILSRIFDHGVELSGGQWQKVALGRAMFPESSFVILD